MDWIGQTLKARYQIDRELGAGGMGNVYLAHDVEVRGRQVVVKVPHAHLLDDEFRTRFTRETDQLIQLAHPHVIHVYDAGEHEQVPFLVVQYVGGGDLQERMRATRQFGPATVLEWLAPIGEALDFIHRRGHVHRDVKPGNVLFDDDGNAFLSDFGIATVMAATEADATRADLTQAGLFIGSPLYAPPEAVVRDLRPQYDQYSLALIAYQCLTGAFPFAADSGPQMMTAKLTQEPRPMAEIAPHLTPGASAVIMQALSRDPSNRYGSCREFTDAFRVGCSGGALDAPAPAGAADQTLVAPDPSGPVGSSQLRTSGVASRPVVVPAADAGRPPPPPPPEPPFEEYDESDEEPPAAARRRRREARRQGRSSAEPRPSVYSSARRGPRLWPWILAGAAVLAVVGLFGLDLLPGLTGAAPSEEPRPIWELEGEPAPRESGTPDPQLPPEMRDFFGDEDSAGAPADPGTAEPEELADRDEEAGAPVPADEAEPLPAADPEPPPDDPPQLAARPPREAPRAPPVEQPEPKPEPRAEPEPETKAEPEPEVRPEPEPKPQPPLDLPAFDVASRSEEGVARVRTNVRASPDSRAEVVNFLTPGNRVKVTGVVEGGDWLRIEAGSGKVGYVKAASLADAPTKPEVPAGQKRALVVVGSGRSILHTALVQPFTRKSMSVLRPQADRGIRIGGKEHWFRFETFTVTIGDGVRDLSPTEGFVETVPLPAGTPASARVELIDVNGQVLASTGLPSKPSSGAQVWVIQPRPGRLEHPIHKGRILLEAQIGLKGGGADVDAAGVSWTSDRDGSLGTGGVVKVNLSAGEHVLTATAPGAASRTVRVDVVHKP